VDLVSGVKLVVIFILCVAVIAGVVAFTQAAGLIGRGLTGLHNAEAGYIIPLDGPANAARFGLDAFGGGEGWFPLTTAFGAFVTFMGTVALLVAVWRLATMLLP